jgi:hypothetical protein
VLSPPDADLVRRERSLPGLAVLLDPEAFVRTLRPHVPGADLRGTSITYIRYKPGTNCLLTYRLETGGGPVTAYAKLYGRDAAVKLRKGREREQVSAPSPLGPGHIVLKEISAVVALFPNDGKMSVLKELPDPAAWRRRLGRLFPERPDLWECGIRTLAYKPERRYVGQLVAGEEPRAVLKYYSGEGFAQADANAGGFRSRGPLRVARRIGRSKRRRILAFEWLRGRLLSEAILDAEPDLEGFAAAGAALAELHAQDPGGLAESTRKREAERLLALADGIAFLHPSVEGRVRSLARRLALLFPEDSAVPGPVHGDFYARQVLMDGGKAALLDLDRAVRGDPAADLGRFLGHLERDALRGVVPPGRAETIGTALIEGYRRASRSPLPPGVEPHMAAALLSLAPDPFRLREPEWPERIEAILERAEAVLDGKRVPV